MPTPSPHRPHDTVVTVTDADACDLAEQLLSWSERPTSGEQSRRAAAAVAILNLADVVAPASGLPPDSASPEVELCRRTGLFQELEAAGSLCDRVLFCPDLAIFRGSRQEMYALRRDAPRVAVVSAAAPPTCAPSAQRLDEFQRRLDDLLAVCVARGHTVVILPVGGDLAESRGGGAPASPTELAVAVRDALRSDAYRGRFRRFAFAVAERGATSGAAALVRACFSGGIPHLAELSATQRGNVLF